MTLIALLAFAGTIASAKTELKIDTAASKVEWIATKKAGGGHNGTIKIKEGTVELNDKNEVKSAKIVVDMTTIENTDLAQDPENQAKLVGHLKNKDFFDVTKKGRETSKFELTKVTKLDGDKYEVSGKLTMIGKTLPIQFPATFKVVDGVLTGEAAEIVIERNKWGLTYNSENFFKNLAANYVIDDTFKLKVSLQAKK